MPQIDDAERARLALLWDEILDVLIARLEDKSIPLRELVHLPEELQRLFSASKGKKGIWASVIDVIAILLKSDASIQDLRRQLPYNDSTIYRALERLQSAGVVHPVKGDELGQLWTIDEDRCPILYRATRR